MPGQFPRHYGVPISVEIGGRRRTLHSGTIRAHLPGLWRREGWMLMQQRQLPLDYYATRSSPFEMKALKLLFEFLSEMDSHAHVSAAILEGLGRMFHGSHGHAGNYSQAAMETFRCLGDLLSRKFFGCSIKIFKQMEAFFLKHNDEILAAPECTLYILVLDRLSLNYRQVQWDMAPALQCLVRELETRGLPSRERKRLEKLSPKSHRILTTLIKRSRKKTRRQFQSSADLRLLHPGRPRLGHRPHSHQGCFPPAPRPSLENRLYLEDIYNMCASMLQEINQRLPLAGMPLPHGPCDYDDEYLLDGEHMYSDDDIGVEHPYSPYLLHDSCGHPDDLDPLFPDRPWGVPRGRHSPRMIGPMVHM